ncbi:hypothetical protein C6W10_21215 [Plantactinospora sp. BB1]|nr:hypothetical protein C6W10_21215 [Plantactinospora sp. BB1]
MRPSHSPRREKSLMAARWFSVPLSLARSLVKVAPFLLDAGPQPAGRRPATTRRRPSLASPVAGAFPTAGLVDAAGFTVSQHVEPAAPHTGADDQLVVRPAGEIDLATAPLLRDALLSAVQRHPRVCCDLGDVTFFSAAGITALMITYGQALGAGCRFTVRRPHGMTRRLLHLAGLGQLLGIPAEPHQLDTLS